MRTFTDNPYERMMMDSRREKPECPSRFPSKNHPCYQCTKYGLLCVKPCEKLIDGMNDKAKNEQMKEENG